MNMPLKIAVIASEAEPYAKTGGLADVAGTLPAELKKLGHEVILILPYYRVIRNSKIASKKLNNLFMAVDVNGIPAYFIANQKYFARKELYGTPKGGYPDNAYRFGFFCREVINLFSKTNFNPDIIHLNDWQTSLVPYYLKTIFKDDPNFKKTKTLLTIHNMAYQGLFSPGVLPGLGLSCDAFVPHGGIEFYGMVNFLKAGLISADAISTVSKKYSKEIQTPEYGCGLDGVLTEQRGHVYGILNGVDYTQWNPEVDKLIASNYTADNLDGKRDCRKDLLNEFDMDGDISTPIIGMISRLTDQKGFDILAEALDEIAKMDFRLLLLGTGEDRYHKLFRKVRKKYPKHFGVKIEFNNRIAHKIEAGSDMFLMPTKYEPCGLNQIFSLKYGTIPIVRATGGLDDTIVNFNPQDGTGNGFKFSEYSSAAMLIKIKEALSFFNNKESWQKLMQNGMRQDFSWHKSAEEYVELYNKILNT